MITDFLILGNGYCGSRLAKNCSALVTSRTPKNDKEIYFEINDKKSWNNLIKAKIVVWTFACKGEKVEEEFFNYLIENISNKIIIYSTSSIFVHNQDKQVINELTAINKQNPRACSEEHLRSKGAAILTLCGIFGPGRNPKNWLMKGLIKDPDKDVNLIHVDDIVELTISLSNVDIWGKRINLCPGESDSWRDLADFYSYEFPNKAIVTKKMRKTVRSCLLETLLQKSYCFLRVRDLPIDL